MNSTMPRIPHLVGSKSTSDDLLLSAEESREFFLRPAVVSEKLDGVSMTVRKTTLGEVTVGLKGPWERASGGRIRRAVDLWTKLHHDILWPLVKDGTQLYAEWLWHRLHVTYDCIPGAAVFYAVRDRRGRLIPRLDALAFLRAGGLPISEPLYVGVIGNRSLTALSRRSAFGKVRCEGVVVEIQRGRGVAWAKWVHPSHKKPLPKNVGALKNRVREPEVTRVR